MAPLPPVDQQALRETFRAASPDERRVLLPDLQPAEIEFAGVRMFVDPRDNYTEQRIWLDGQPPEMQSLMALVELVEGKRALVLDVGANCGAFSVPLGLAAGQGGRVIAFEPNPVMIERLEHNIALNQLGDVVCIEKCALGAEAGEAVLNFRHGNFGQASLMPIRPRLRAGGRPVPLRVLTDFMDGSGRYDTIVLKVDVEGAEEAVLAPMLRADARLPDAILMETRHADQWYSDLIGQIKTLGFAATLEADGNTLFEREKAA